MRIKIWTQRLRHMMSPDSFVWFQMTRAQDLPKKNRRSSDGEKRRGR